VVPAAPGVVTEPGLVMYQFGAALFYANSNRFAEEILGLVGPKPSAVRWVIVDAEAITNVDYSAARVVLALKDHLDAEGVRLGFARVPWETKADFARHHVTEAVSPEMMFTRLHDALDAFEKLNETEKA